MIELHPERGVCLCQMLAEDLMAGHARRKHAVQYALDVCVRKRETLLSEQLQKVDLKMAQIRHNKREVPHTLI